MNKKEIMDLINKIKPHLIVLLLFSAISFTYFTPILEGKMLDMPDIQHYIGMSKEVVDFREATGEEALWTNSMFSGMPAYQISAKYSNNLIRYVVKVISLGMPRPISLLFLYLLGFYLLLLSLGVDYRISAIGAIAFSFSSYLFIIIQAGHMTKAHAIAYMPMVVAAVLYTYRGKILLGGLLTALAVSLQLYANHLQITYYLVLILLLIGLVQFIKDLRSNTIIEFTKRTGVLFLAALLASGTSFTRLATTMEYGKDSTRGKSELTTNLDNKTTGLDKDYATAWSYGIAETFTLLIPNFYGGASQGKLTTDSETYKELRKRTSNAKQLIKQLPLYWGDQPFTSGPTYAGSIVIFLFVLGLLFVKSEMRIWLVMATIMSIMLAWGKNFMGLTEFFLDHFPGYNKFRAVSMILVVAEFTLPLLGFIALNRFLDSNQDNINHSTITKDRALKLAFYIVGGITLIFALTPSLFFDFIGGQDANLQKNGWPVEALQSDRAGLLQADAWRSFIFITLTFGVLLMYLRSKIESKYVILVVGILVISDMWTVNKRYLNDDNFERKRKVEVPYQATSADKQILRDRDPNFRVFNQSVSTFNDASTSYFHKSIGGYHGAKLKRYQELIENHISKGNMSVLNMLNAKYFISPKGKVQQNYEALGNVWFVNNISIVENADAELLSLGDFLPSKTAIVDRRFRDQVFGKNNNIDTSVSLFEDISDYSDSEISLIEYKPNYLSYRSISDYPGIAIFSEVYYNKGWNAYIDGELKPHFRANYILRGMRIPQGEHLIEFRFEPAVYKNGEQISLVCSSILLLLLGLVFFKELRA
mgnify:CR=1 FL=1